jgi:hypothetical protein
MRITSNSVVLEYRADKESLRFFKLIDFCHAIALNECERAIGPTPIVICNLSAAKPLWMNLD